MASLNLAWVTERVVDAARRAGRDPSEVKLVAITKDQPLPAIRAAYEAGQRDFGENRAQDLVRRTSQLPADIRWHFVGHLQRNKVRLVRPVVVLLHSMDRPSLGEAWLKGPGTPPPALLQVNVAREPQKSGVAPEDAEEMVARLTELGVNLRGLMAIPPMGPAPQARPYFALLARLREKLAAQWPTLSELSMGMTDDFETAVEEGSTMLRVGRAIFGPRHPV